MSAALLVVAIIVFGWATNAKAATSELFPVPDPAVNSKTIILDTTARLGIFPNALMAPGTVLFQTSATLPTLPANQELSGVGYQITVSGTTLNPVPQRTLIVGLPWVTSYWPESVWQYDNATSTWTKLASGRNRATNESQAKITTTDGYVALLVDKSKEHGYATWYCKNSCSTKYPKLHATSNDFPVNSYVTVTNPVNGASVTVKIVSGWGQPAGRIIDLSWSAYSALKAKNAGVTYVTVKPGVAPKSVPAAIPTNTAEPDSPKTISQVSTSNPPDVSAVSYVVVDQGTGKVLSAQHSDDIRSIASITKLMTAMVVLDHRVPFTKTMTYSKSDVTPYAYLQVRIGEKLTVKDLFYSMLVGSANNAATVLARSTGMTRSAFVAAMNAKAQALGLTQTHFTDTNGLDIGNVSTANDLAKMGAYAFHNYADIRAATTAKSYTFTTINTKRKHTIKTTDKVLLSQSLAKGVTISGAKTGYIDEAMYTYVIRAKNAQGANIVAVVLGSPSSSARFNAGVALTNWAFSSYRWTT